MPRRLADREDNEIWAEFYQLYKNLVLGYSKRAGLVHADAEEVVQDVFAEVATNVQQYLDKAQRGSFRGWLLNLTRWRVFDKLRRRRQVERRHVSSYDCHLDDRTRTIERVVDHSILSTEALWEEEWEKQLFCRALENIRGKVAAGHFQAFELQVVQHVPVKKIAHQLGLNRGAVYVITFRLKKQISAEVRRLKSEFE